MHLRLVSSIVLGLALGLTAATQDAPTAAPQSGGGQGQHTGRGGGFGMGGRGLIGTVTEAAADHYTIKTETGDTYTIHFTTSTRIFKQSASRGFGRGQGRGATSQDQAGAATQGAQSDAPGEGSETDQENQGQSNRRGYGRGNPPQPLQPSDIKVGDAINVMGSIDASAKSVAAFAIILIDPERARQMAQMQANYGKTWLMGRITAIDGVKVTLTGSMDNAPHSFVADENTTFRKRREPITLADIQVGDMVRADGALKDGVFVAAAVNAMTMPPGGPANMPRNSPAGTPSAAPPQ